MNPIILIPARLKATRLPDKPLRAIAGHPMIVRVWYRAMESAVGRVVVATDNEDIKALIKRCGGEAVMTDANHHSGSDRIYEALQKVDAQGAHDVIINLQGDVPEILPAYIRTVLEPLQNLQADIGTLAAKTRTEEERNDPAVVKVIITGIKRQDGGMREEGLGEGRRPSEPSARGAASHASDSMSRSGDTKSGIGQAFTFTRITPDGDVLYHHIGIYAYRRQALERFVSLPPSANEQREKLEQLRALDAGMRIDVALVDEVPYGVDTPEHLAKVSAKAKPLAQQPWFKGA